MPLGLVSLLRRVWIVTVMVVPKLVQVRPGHVYIPFLDSVTIGKIDQQDVVLLSLLPYRR